MKLSVPMYNVETGEFPGFRNWLAYIMVRGDDNELFLPHGYGMDKSSILYSNFKQILPNIFQGTSFKKHNTMLLNKQSVQSFLKLLFPTIYHR